MREPTINSSRENTLFGFLIRYETTSDVYLLMISFQIFSKWWVIDQKKNGCHKCSQEVTCIEILLFKFYHAFVRHEIFKKKKINNRRKDDEIE